jgi:hypothetical protein
LEFSAPKIESIARCVCELINVQKIPLLDALKELNTKEVSLIHSDIQNTLVKKRLQIFKQEARGTIPPTLDSRDSMECLIDLVICSKINQLLKDANRGRGSAKKEPKEWVKIIEATKRKANAKTPKPIHVLKVFDYLNSLYNVEKIYELGINAKGKSYRILYFNILNKR